MNRTILRLLGLLALSGISFVLARLLVAAWLPGGARMLVLGVPLLALIFIFAYVALFGRYRYTGDLPYFLLRPDFLLPLSAFSMMLLVFLVVAPRFAIWQWGEEGRGIVQALSVEEYDDIDLGTTRSYRVDYVFDDENGESAARTSYVSETLFDTLQAGDTIAVHYMPWWSRLITAGDPRLFAWQATVLVWPMLIVLLWLAGMAAYSRRRYAPPPAPPYPEPLTTIDLLRRYDLDTLLTEEDDAQLWAAVVRKQFPMPEEESAPVEGLRFAIGEFAADARLRMQRTAVTCFSRLDEHHLQRAPCAADEETDADFDAALLPVVPLLVLYLNRAKRDKWPLYSIVVPRPSSDAEHLPVYTAVCRRNGNASGETAYWQRLADGRWQHSGENVNWWADGA